VHIILPDANINAVVLGSLILMMTAANLFGLYSEFLQFKAILLKSRLHPKLIVDVIFYRMGLGMTSLAGGIVETPLKFTELDPEPGGIPTPPLLN